MCHAPMEYTVAGVSKKDGGDKEIETKWNNDKETMLFMIENELSDTWSKKNPTYFIADVKSSQ